MSTLELAGLAEILAVIGLAQGWVGSEVVRSFRRRQHEVASPGSRPPVSVLKPLYGDEALLEDALASFCVQQYEPFQVVFGVQWSDDPALAVIQRLRTRYPCCDIAVVVDPRRHGSNGKVSNLLNMVAAARYDVLIVSDSDVHAPLDYLDRIIAALTTPGTGLVTTLYTGLPANRSLAAALGATWITHNFLPGALLARCLGRQDCLGATMALRRHTLQAIGSFSVLADVLADDQALGQLVRGRGLAVRLATTVPATTVPESTFLNLVRHELRWNRTVLAIEPLGFCLSFLIQHPLFWALLAAAVSGGRLWASAGFAAAWGVRAILARAIDRALDLAKPTCAAQAPLWLLPLRDLLSVVVMIASFGSDRVEWRGAILRARPLMHTAAPSSGMPEKPAGAA